MITKTILCEQHNQLKFHPPVIVAMAEPRHMEKAQLYDLGAVIGEYNSINDCFLVGETFIARNTTIFKHYKLIEEY
jgi:hypothetical protein